VHERVLGFLHISHCSTGRDPLAPRLDDRRQDDLEDVRFCRVVRAERPLALLAERALQERAEDRRLHLAPARVARLAEELELLTLEMHAGRLGEERAVRVRRARVQPFGRPVVALVQVCEELTEVVATRARRIGDEPVEHAREEMRREHREVLREHRPDGLEHEAPQHLGHGGAPLLKPSVDVRDELDSLARDLGLVVHEDGPATREEEERVEVVGQLDEVERCPRLRVHRARLPDLEAMEGAEHDIPGCRTRGRP
jgi:hypothetical protein